MRHFARDHRLLITLPLLLVMLAIVPALTMGLTWVRQVGLLSADAVVFASDAPAMDRFMARAMKGVYGDRVQICDGTADDVELQAAVNALTQGGRILYSGGTFHPSTYITMSASDNLPMCFEGRGDSTTFSFSRGDLAASGRQLFTNYNGVDRYDVKDIRFCNMKFVEENAVVATSYGDGIGTGYADGDSSNHNISVVGCEFDHCGVRILNVDTGRVMLGGNYVHDVVGNCLNDMVLAARYCDAPVVIEANTVNKVYDMGIVAQDCTSGVVIVGNTVIDNGQTGTSYAICTDSCVDVQISLNNVQGRYGINSEDDIGPVLISYNTVSGTTDYGIGILVWGNGDHSPYQVDVSHNSVTSMKYGINLNSVADAIVSHNKVRTSANYGIYVLDAKAVTPRRTQILYNDLYDFADVTAYQGGIRIAVDYVDIIGNNIDGNSNTNARAIIGNNGTQANCRILDNNITGIGSASNIMYQVGTGAEIRGNKGYIAPGEVRTYAVTITAGTENTTSYLQNPLSQNVWVTSATFVLTTAATGGNPNYDIGTDADGSGAPSVSALFTNVPDTVATYNSWSNDVGSTSGGAFGVQTAYWQLDAAGGTNDYVGIIIDDADGTGAVGTLYVTVMGQ